MRKWFIENNDERKRLRFKGVCEIGFVKIF